MKLQEVLPGQSFVFAIDEKAVRNEVKSRTIFKLNGIQYRGNETICHIVALEDAQSVYEIDCQCQAKYRLTSEVYLIHFSASV